MVLWLLLVFRDRYTVVLLYPDNDDCDSKEDREGKDGEKIPLFLNREETNGIFYIDVLFPFDRIEPENMQHIDIIDSEKNLAASIPYNGTGSFQPGENTIVQFKWTTLMKANQRRHWFGRVIRADKIHWQEALFWSVWEED